VSKWLRFTAGFVGAMLGGAMFYAWLGPFAALLWYGAVWCFGCMEGKA
jgi:hypothetical protein